MNQTEEAKERGPPLSANMKQEMIGPVPWMHQWITLLRYKTLPLLARRPLFIAAMALSSVVSVLLSWSAGRDYEVYAPTDGSCGAPDPDFAAKLGLEDNEQYSVHVSISDRWQGAVPVLLLSFGPAVFAIGVYIMVHEEIRLHLFGILRGLGVRDSVYWMSWFVPFAVLAMFNALLGAITAQFLPVHVYQSVYFGGIFLSLWFVQLALMSASMCAAAMTGTARRVAVVWLVAFLLAVLVPWLLTSVKTLPRTAYDLVNYGTTDTSSGLFWFHQTTESPTFDFTFTGGDGGNFNFTSNDDGSFQEEPGTARCNAPIMSFEEGSVYKTAVEQSEVATQDVFVGCYAHSGTAAMYWSLQGPAKVGTIFLYLVPYFHLHTIFGNFLGYTANQQHKFTSREASMSSSILASDDINVDPPDLELHLEQGALVVTRSGWQRNIPCEQYSSDEDPLWGDRYCEIPKSNCIRGNSDLRLCQTSQTQCYSARPVDAPSVHALLGHLAVLTILYLLLAAYWGIAFVDGTLRFYFPLQWSYWFSPSTFCRSSDVVEIKSVKKSYGSVQAVKDVSLRMVAGEITALLGHNGAGKTTLSNMIICESSATSGDISVMGHSVKEASPTVRRVVGVCKQDDYLWQHLTAKEHLFLFAGLRGVGNSRQGATVQKWLESVDLDLVQNQLSREFSGGMKRRLSLALSTIGGSPLIVLDEPTTGMDPVSRRFVWKHIDEIKKDRVILLTTHSMEEADLLSDQVAIMKEGEIAAVGTSLELKTRHGSALQFSLLTKSDLVGAALASMERLFAKSTEYVQLNSNESGNIKVNVSKIQQIHDECREGIPIDELLAFVAWLEDDASPVVEYGFSNSSLEEVFLKITESENIEPSPESTQLATADDVVIADDEGVPVELEMNNLLGSFQPNLSTFGQLEGLLYHHVTRAWTGRRSIGTWITVLVLSGLVGFVGTAMSNAHGIEHIGFVAPIVVVSLFVLLVSSSLYSDRSDGLLYLMKSQGLLSSSWTMSYALYSLQLGLVLSTLVLTIYFATPVFREPEFCSTSFCPWPSFGQRPLAIFPTPISLDVGDLDIGDLDISLEEAAELYGDLLFGGGSGFTLFAYRSPRGYGPIFLASIIFGTAFPGFTLALSYLPGNKIALVIIAVILVASSMTPLFLSNLSRSMDPAEVQRCLGVVEPTLNCTTTTFGIDNITEGFLNCAGSSINSLGLGTLCQPAVMGLLPQFALFQELTVSLLGRITFVSNPPSFVEDELIPRLIRQGQDCSGTTCDFPYARKLYWQTMGYQVLGSVVLLLLGVFIAVVYSFPPDTVLRMRKKLFGSFSVGSGEPSRLADVQEQNYSKEVSDERKLVEQKMKDNVTTSNDGLIVLGDKRVVHDRMPPIIMHRLRKVYPASGKVPPKVALESLDLQVPNGQVLGLLGKNGAGKTTALKILSCAHEASSGIGLVAGYDVELQKLDVFTRLGNCAQFDKIWPRLSVKEHLTFFSRLKGVPREYIHQNAKGIAVAVGLGSDASVYNRSAGALSGGMRRRLSIAIALVASPKALLLDEPTTGLDPSTRKGIWDLISALSTSDRAIILTTHQMIEADTLCDRIAIMAKGKLAVVGTSQYLKDNYGSGYVLQLNLVHKTPESEAAAMNFCRESLHPDSVLALKQAKTLHVKLPPDLDLQRVFSKLYDSRLRPSCINQFLLNQSSLEDVFFSLGDGLPGPEVIQNPTSESGAYPESNV